MTADAGTRNRQLLLLESDGLVRGTVVSVCRQLDIVRVLSATSVARGVESLKAHVIDGLLISVADREPALDLLARLRAGEFACRPDLPVAVMATSCDQALAVRLKELEVRRLLLQPFRLRDVIHTLEQMLAIQETAQA